MDKVYTILTETTTEVLSSWVNSRLDSDDTLIGGPFPFAGMVCQAMMVTIHEEEAEHERDDSADNDDGD